MKQLFLLGSCILAFSLLSATEEEKCPGCSECAPGCTCGCIKTEICHCTQQVDTCKCGCKKDEPCKCAPECACPCNNS